MTTILLVRHASTRDTGRRLTGWADGVGLTERGLEEARATARALTGMSIDALYSSPIQRARETAAAVSGILNLPIRTNEGIGEVQYGKWTNRSLKVLARTKLWEVVQAWPSGARFPEGETLREVQVRTVGEIETLSEAHAGKTICCVSHADVIKLVVAHYLGVHIDLFQRLVISPASLSVVALGERGPRVPLVNWVPALRGMTS